MNAVAPGGVRTNLEVNIAPGTLGIGAYRANVRRMAETDELANAIVFLASDAASNITGAIVPVDGGWSAV